MSVEFFFLQVYVRVTEDPRLDIASTILWWNLEDRVRVEAWE